MKPASCLPFSASLTQGPSDAEIVLEGLIESGHAAAPDHGNANGRSDTKSTFAYNAVSWVLR